MSRHPHVAQQPSPWAVWKDWWGRLTDSKATDKPVKGEKDLITKGDKK